MQTWNGGGSPSGLSHELVDQQPPRGSLCGFLDGPSEKEAGRPLQ